MPGLAFSHRGASEVAFPIWLKVLAPADWIVAGLWTSLFILTKKSVPIVSIFSALLAFISLYRTIILLPRFHKPPSPIGEI
jgi:hypothetical protein